MVRNLDGTVGSRIMERSILKHIPGKSLPGISLGDDYGVLTSVGAVYAVGRADIDEGIDDKAWSDYHYENEFVSAGRLALVKALNNFSMSGSRPAEALIDISLFSAGEGAVRHLMSEMVKWCDAAGIRIAGGNTSYTGDDAVTVTLIGGCDIPQDRRKPEPGDKLVMIGYTAGYATVYMAYKMMQLCRDLEITKDRTESEEQRASFDERCKERYGEIIKLSTDYVEEAYRETIGHTDITAAAYKLYDSGALYMHDVSYGGIYRTLYELSKRTGLGVCVNHDLIPIRQDTIELCERLNLNPYTIMGTGAFTAVVTADGHVVSNISNYSQDGIPAAVIGELTHEKAATVTNSDGTMKRSINIYEGEELFAAVSERIGI